jgi:hypothetical protein
MHHDIPLSIVQRELAALEDATVLARTLYNDGQYSLAKNVMFDAVKLASALHTRLHVLADLKKM